VLWLKQLLRNSGCQCDKAIVVKIDNQSAIKLIRNHKRNKHIDIRYHFVRKKKKKNIPARTPRFILNPALKDRFNL